MNNTKSAKSALFETDHLSALEAIDRAQLIAFAPYVWEAARLLKDKGLLLAVEASKDEGLTVSEVAAQSDLSAYGCRILLEAGLGIGLLFRRNDRFLLSKTGHVFLNHRMTEINYAFMRDVCAAGAPSLEESIRQSRPAGLKVFGNWPTLYEGLTALPTTAKESWLAFDHYYSDNAFPEALALIFEKPPRKLLDIGANTGRWSLKCLEYDAGVRVGLVDLPQQLEMAKENLEGAGVRSRATFHPMNILVVENELPKGYDLIWMSQFLDCFSDEEIVMILEKCYRASDENTRIFINETFWDRQRFPTSAFALQMTSLYFTTMANGNSQMYDSRVFCKLIQKAGFEIVRQTDGIGLSHTILELRKKTAS